MRFAPSLAFTLLTLAGAGEVARAQETITPLTNLPASTDTCCKPQSKLWFHDGRWWAIMPSTSVSPSGTWLWRLEASNTWANVLRLSSVTGSRADARSIVQLNSSGDPVDVTHVFLHGSTPQLASIEYAPNTGTYTPWSVRPTLTAVSLPGSETATIDIDSNHRIWLSTEAGSNVTVFYSDYPYTVFKGPLILANNILQDDITSVIALRDPPGIGVFWSNQNTKVFGFRVHPDAADKDPEDLSAWGPDEMPGLSAPRFGAGVADDHMHLALASDGTLYASIKTSYNSSSFPLIGLLVRRPTGTWDNLYQVDTGGTRPIVVLNEPLDLLRVIYTSASGGGNILYRDSRISSIGFGARRTLMTGSLNNATSTKEGWTDQLVVLASGRGVLFRETGVTTTTTTSVTTSTAASTSSTTTTTATSTSTAATAAVSTTTTTASSTSTAAPGTSTSTTITPPSPSGVNAYQAGVSGPAGSADVDTFIRLSTPTTNWGTDVNLYVGVTNGPDKVFRTLIAFDLRDIPAGARVSACTLTVNVTQRTNPTAGHVRRLCSEHWLDAGGQSEAQATWSVWKSGAAWTVAGAGSTAACAAGGDYTIADEVPYTPPPGTGRFTFPDLSTLCQDALTQRGGWLRLRISQDVEATQSNLIKFDSSDAGTAANRPRLSVTWFFPTTSTTTLP